MPRCSCEPRAEPVARAALDPVGGVSDPSGAPRALVTLIDKRQAVRRLRGRGSSLHQNARARGAQERVETRYIAGHEALAEYVTWVDVVHAARMMRNALVQGRRGVDPMMRPVAHVDGLRTSPEQNSTGSSVIQLMAMLECIVQLQVRLAELRERWPV